MDKSLFQPESPGRLHQITVGQDHDWSFLPAPLPPDWSFPQELWPPLAEAKHAMGILEGIGRHLPDPDLLLRPLQEREAIRSSSLEGTVATPKEMALYELDPRYPTSEDDPANAWREVFNYGRALRAGITTLDKISICLRLIAMLHRVLYDGRAWA